MSHIPDCSGSRHGRLIRAFTLVELLVVISIVALLMAILMPALSKAREASRRTLCGIQEKQITFALLNYAGDHKGWFPAVNRNSPNVFSYKGKSLVPYLTSTTSMTVTPAVRKTVMCPNRDNRLQDSYVDNAGSDIMGTTYNIVAARGDGPSQEIDSYLAKFSDCWYGWKDACEPVAASGYYNRYNLVAPVPREQLAVKVAPSRQAVMGEVYYHTLPATHASFPNAGPYVNPPAGSSSTAVALRSNHIEGMNTAFLDGHVRWSLISNFGTLNYVQWWSNTNADRIWW